VAIEVSEPLGLIIHVCIVQALREELESCLFSRRTGTEPTNGTWRARFAYKLWQFSPYRLEPV
jgi:hypothetical protein